MWTWKDERTVAVKESLGCICGKRGEREKRDNPVEQGGVCVVSPKRLLLRSPNSGFLMTKGKQQQCNACDV